MGKYNYQANYQIPTWAAALLLSTTFILFFEEKRMRSADTHK
jgi:hypothetical protein